MAYKIKKTKRFVWFEDLENGLKKKFTNKEWDKASNRYPKKRSEKYGI